jgi:hypothetical protein
MMEVYFACGRAGLVLGGGRIHGDGVVLDGCGVGDGVVFGV